MTALALSPLAITATGMVTAVGFNAPASCAAMRAGISGVKQANLWDAESGEYLTAAKVPLPQWWEGYGKHAELVAPAIHECLAAAAPRRLDEIPLLLVVAPSSRHCRIPELDTELLGDIAYKLEARLHPDSRIIPQGPVGGVVALQEASRLLSTRRARCCIIAGVDSFLQQKVIEAYLEKRRVLTPLNSNGFIPGEAGTAILVVPAGSSPNDELQILGASITKEHATITAEEPLRAEGLTQAIGEAMEAAQVTLRDVAYRITDLNGEHYKFKEATVASMRFERKTEKPRERLFDIWHPIEYIGEIGAAITPCLISIALSASQKGYALGDTALLHVGNDDGERAALVTRFSQAVR